MALPLVVQTEDLDAAAAAWLGERCRLVRTPAGDDAALDELLAQAQGLVVRTYTRVTGELLSKAPGLKVVARAGVGLDNIDLPACRARGVSVVYTPDANGSAVSELVFAALLDAIRPRVFLDHALDPARWAEVRRELIARRQLENLALGIVGLGKVGSRIARIAGAFGMRASYHDLLQIHPAGRFGAAPVPLDRLLRESEVVTVHVDGRASNRSLIRAEHFAMLRPDAVFINTSRGFVVDTSALATFLRHNPGAAAILDVHEPEPIDPSNPLLGLPNAHLMPHIGAATAAAHAKMSWVVRDVVRVLNGERPEFPAPDLLYSETRP